MERRRDADAPPMRLPTECGEASKHRAEAVEECEDGIDRSGIGEAETFDGLEGTGGFAGLGASDAEARDAVIARSIGRLGGLEESPLECAPELIGERAESSREGFGQVHPKDKCLESNVVSVQPMVVERVASWRAERDDCSLVF
jgi:hypothetical protein